MGYGQAPPTGVIIGDTTGAIIGAIKDHIAPSLIGRDVDDFENLDEGAEFLHFEKYKREGSCRYGAVGFIRTAL